MNTHEELRKNCILQKDAYITSLLHYARSCIPRLNDFDIKECLEIINEFSEAIPLIPKKDTSIVKTVLAAAKLLVGAYDEAIQYCTDVLDVTPGSSEALAFRGRAKFMIHDDTGANVDSKDAIKSSSENYFAYCTLALVALRQNDLNLAFTAISQALKAKPSNYTAHTICAHIFLLKNDTKKMIEHAEKAIEANKQYANGYSLRAYGKYLQKELESASEDCHRALKLDPSDIAPCITLAFIDIEYKNIDQAVANVSKVLNKDPNNYFAYAILARLSLIQGDNAKAIEYCDTSMTFCSSFFHTYETLARANFITKYSKGEDLQQAYEFCNQAIRLNANSSHAFATRARINLAECKLFSAISDSRQAIKLDPKNEYAYAVCGAAHEGSANYKEAIHYYQILLQLNPEAEEIITTEIKKIQQNTNVIREENQKKRNKKRGVQLKWKDYSSKKFRSESDSSSKNPKWSEFFSSEADAKISSPKEIFSVAENDEKELEIEKKNLFGHCLQ